MCEMVSPPKRDRDGAAGTPNGDVFWSGLESIVNRNGQLTTQGYLFDMPADGFAGFTFNISAYPGLQALHDEAFDAFRSRMASLLPDLDPILEEGGAGAIGEWFKGVVDKAADISPSLGAAMAAFPVNTLSPPTVPKPRPCWPR